MPLLECVPNVSEGRDQKIIQAIADEVRKLDGVKLLHIDSGYDTNRTVYTFAGDPDKVVEAAFQLIKKATELIDMSKHKGTHPRVGAVDVCPLVPLKEIHITEAAKLSHELAERVGKEINIPVYCYEHSALSENKTNLEDIRKGEYEGLKEKMQDEQWKPDFGPSEFNSKSGATVIGARRILIAYNINLSDDDVDSAKLLAGKIRQSSNLPTSLSGVKAIGWYSEEHDIAQVSVNITNHLSTGIGEVYSSLRILAIENHTSIEGSELIGLVPLESMLRAGEHLLSLALNVVAKPDEEVIKLVVQKTGLDELSPFDPKRRIIEYALKEDEV